VSSCFNIMGQHLSRWAEVLVATWLNEFRSKGGNAAVKKLVKSETILLDNYMVWKRLNQQTISVGGCSFIFGEEVYLWLHPFGAWCRCSYPFSLLSAAGVFWKKKTLIFMMMLLRKIKSSMRFFVIKVHYIMNMGAQLPWCSQNFIWKFCASESSPGFFQMGAWLTWCSTNFIWSFCAWVHP
jgi:hypothetical protein